MVSHSSLYEKGHHVLQLYNCSNAYFIGEIQPHYAGFIPESGYSVTKLSPDFRELKIDYRLIYTCRISAGDFRVSLSKAIISAIVEDLPGSLF